MATPTAPMMPIDFALQDGFLQQNNSQRLLELINSPPPIIDQNGKSRISLPSFGYEPSERLTAPIRPVNRHSNTYVKTRPQSSRELINGESNNTGVLNRINSVNSSDLEEIGVEITQTLDVLVHRSQTSSSLTAPNETAL